MKVQPLCEIQSVRHRDRVSRDEIVRRWGAVRAAMEAQSIDVVVAQANNDYVGGNLQWLSGLYAADEFSATVMLGRTGGITATTSTGAVEDVELPIDNDRAPGVTRLLTAPGFASVKATNAHQGRMIVEGLRDYAHGTIGLIGLQQFSAVSVDAIRHAYPGANIIDASDIIDPIKAVKSEEELAIIRATADLQDQAMAKIFTNLRPGMTERDIYNYAQQIAYESGANQGLFVFASAPAGQPAHPKRLRDLSRTIAKGDTVQVLLETDSTGGLYTHIARTAVFGKPSDIMRDEHRFVVDAQAYLAGLLQPGAKPSDVMEQFHTHMVGHDRPPERRLNCHAQGYDMVERPLMQPEETMAIQENMNIACHPMYMRNNVFAWTCGNYIVGRESTRPIHRFPSEIAVL